MKPSQRGRLLLKLADLVEQNVEALALTETCDNGKVYGDNCMQIRFMAEFYRYFGGLADKIEGSVIPVSTPNVFNFTRYEPLGVVALITPWNSPLSILASKLSTALAAGNTVVIKPSEFTSASTLEFMALVEQAGFPPGVVNVVTGFGNEVGTALVSHPGIAKVGFTGSGVGGRQIYETVARDFKTAVLELGGKSPNIVFDDADLDAAAPQVAGGIFGSTGQSCISGSRLLVQRSVHDALVEKVVEAARRIRIGDPMEKSTNIGPIATAPQFRKIMEYLDIARREGATCVLGGGRYTGPGARGEQMVEPTIFTNVRNSMRIAQEEIFGPVLAVIPFETEEEAVTIANDTPYGLAAGIWTRDIVRGLRVAEQMQAGQVWINTYRSMNYASPSGGYKHSGVGRENGVEAIKEYLQVKSVWLATPPAVVPGSAVS
jgi:aldehyde dehydrogenase (NAD+)